ncbi:hypothetical protein BJV82DRAFT_674642 [Fennellomyces sp. T-0311]|nr:hypothetical protein BJV82DRAFT_674642 [Fennellomyces sp. T-0311]
MLKKARNRCIATSGTFFENGEEVKLSPSKAPRISIVDSASRDDPLQTRSNNNLTRSPTVKERRNFEEIEMQRHKSLDYDNFELRLGTTTHPWFSYLQLFTLTKAMNCEERQLPNTNHRRPSFSGTYTVASAQLTASDRTAINWANSYDDLKKACLRGIAHGDLDSRI